MKKTYLLLLALCMSFAVGCDDSGSAGGEGGEDQLAGTWILTYASGTYDGSPISGTPGEIGGSMTVTLNSSSSASISITLGGENFQKSGTWSATSTTITLSATTGETGNWPYSMEGTNTLNVTIDLDELGLNVYGASGEWDGKFTRQ